MNIIISQLNDLIKLNNNCVNLGRHILAKYPALHNTILQNTAFLNTKSNVTFNERVYCIINSISDITIDALGRQARFDNLFTGYYMAIGQKKEYDAKLQKELDKSIRLKAKQSIVKKTKIEQYIEQNRKKNKHLYNENAVLGYDYVVCPIIGERLYLIKSTYITGVLGMKVEDYPDVQRSCTKHIENIKTGVQQIDPKTGLTKYELGQRTARKTLSKLDENGESGYDKKGKKTRSTHMNNVDEFGRNGYSQLASKAIINGNLTKMKRGIITDVCIRARYYRYKAVVMHLTQRLRTKLTAGYITGRCGDDNAYQLDHNYSIYEGYRNNISPILIGHIGNLRMISWEENLSKHTDCGISLDELFVATDYTLEQSNNEFDTILAIIDSDIENKVPPTGGSVIERFYATL